MSISTLGFDIRQILTAQETSNKEFLADPWGNYFYSSKYFMKGLYRVVWYLNPAYFFQNRAKEECLRLAMERAFRNFNQQFLILKTNLEIFEETLDTILTQTEAELLKNPTCKFLEEWHFQVMPAISYNGFCNVSKNIESVIDIFKKHVPYSDETIQLDFKPLSDAAEDSFNIIKFKNLLDASIPVPIIHKIIKKVTLSRSEKEKFDEFAEKILKNINIEDPRRNIELSDLHTFIRILVVRWKEENIPLYKKIGRLYYALHQVFQKNGSNILIERDSEYMEHLSRKLFKEHFKPIIFESQNLSIEHSMISQEDHKPNKHFVFTCNEDPRKVIIFGCLNYSQLFIEDQIEENLGWGLPMAKLLLIHPDGYKIEERLSNDTVQNYMWTLESNEEEKVKARFESFVKFISHMYENNYTPIGIEADQIRFTEQNQLAFCKSYPIGPFDYDSVLNFLSIISVQNFVIYQKIIPLLNLSRHPLCILYNKCLELALDKKFEESFTELEKISFISEEHKEACRVRVSYLMYAVKPFIEEVFFKIQRNYVMPFAKFSQKQMLQEAKEYFKGLRIIPKNLNNLIYPFTDVILKKYKLYLRKELFDIVVINIKAGRFEFKETREGRIFTISLQIMLLTLRSGKFFT